MVRCINMAIISVSKNGQAFVTIPKALFEALGWQAGTEIRFEIMGKGKLKLEETGFVNPRKNHEEVQQEKPGV